MQKACYEYVRKDKENRFMEAMELFLKKTNALFTQTEALRVMIERASQNALVEKGELRQEDEDLITLRKESKTFINHVILGLQFLQLLIGVVVGHLLVEHLQQRFLTQISVLRLGVAVGG